MNEQNNATPLMPTGERLVVSSSPHLGAADSTRRIMRLVVISLLPAAAAGVWFFGMRALAVLLCTLLSTLLAEYLWCRLFGKDWKNALGDGSAAVTGLLLGLSMPPTAPWWVCLIGGFLAIWLGKQVFGGLGHNPFNPAIVARVGLLIALPAAMSFWPAPRTLEGACPVTSATRIVTTATPLDLAGQTPKITADTVQAAENFAKIDNPAKLHEYFWGARGGCIGETCLPALLLGGLLLLLTRVINWRIPVTFLGTLALMTGLIHAFWPGVTPSAAFHLCTGGAVLVAIFMATDMVTSPATHRGMLLFGCGCGLLTASIRIFGNYPEGVSFAVLFMNALSPLIDRWCAPASFGHFITRTERKAVKK